MMANSANILNGKTGKCLTGLQKVFDLKCLKMYFKSKQNTHEHLSMHTYVYLQIYTEGYIDVRVNEFYVLLNASFKVF